VSWRVYWGAWFLLSFVTFIVPETIALVSGKTENTLSRTFWALEQFEPGQDYFAKWTALHFLVGGMLAVVLAWLIGHLVFGLWR
jgi:hypothetical protein